MSEEIVGAIDELTHQVKRIADFLSEGGVPPVALKELENLNLPLFNFLLDQKEEDHEAKD